MSESTTETQKPDDDDLVVNLDEFGKLAVDKVNSQIEVRNALATKVAGVTGGDESAIAASLRESSEHPEIVKIREALAKYTEQMAQLEAKADGYLAEEITAAKASVEADQKSLDEMDGNIRAGVNYLSKSYGKDVSSLLTDLVNRKNRANPSRQGGEGARRIRGFDVYVEGKLATSRDPKGVERSSLSAAAKEANVETAVMRDEFFKAQGTKDVDKFQERVEFKVNSPKNNTVYNVIAVRQAEDVRAADKSEA